jgi:UDP-N-acetylglucosamine transferase subunit ALG13
MDQPLKEKIPQPKGRKSRILVAPLDWGLGHATRCIPIIRELLAQGCDVWLAGEGAQEHLLKTEFPQLPFLNLPGYRIFYSKTKKGLLWKMIQQVPKMRRAILYEHEWLKRVVKENRFDAVISDNRYGLYHPGITCIFITHQLNIKSSAGRWSEKILQNRNYKYINRFTKCWVPDAEGENNLGGRLSHPEKKPAVPVQYIGLLSRFEKGESPHVTAAEEKPGHLLIILSGPEPQRSILENKMLREISHYYGTATMVRGLPGSSSLVPSTNMLQFYNHLPADELHKELLQAEYVISRCGYSTVMDLVTLQKKSILIPTPGQSEQEYLSKTLFQKQFAFCISQKEFSLSDALAKAKQFDYHFPEINTGRILQLVISNFIANLAKV